MFGTPTQTFQKSGKRDETNGDEDQFAQSDSISLDIDNVDLRVRQGSGQSARAPVLSTDDDEGITDVKLPLNKMKTQKIFD